MADEVALIGGKGKMGSWFASFFAAAGFPVHVLDEGSESEYKGVLPRTKIIFLAVPLAKTKEVAANCLPLLGAEQLFVDIASVKTPLISTYANRACQILSLHPLFGPHVSSFRRQVVVCSEVASGALVDRVLELLKNAGAELRFSGLDDHDRIMAVIQGLTHFAAISAAGCLRELGVSIEDSMQFASPVYRLRMDMIGRIMAQDASLYAEIETLNPYVPEVLERFSKCVSELKQFVADKNCSGFSGFFNSAKEHFAGFSPQALAETNSLIRFLAEQD